MAGTRRARLAAAVAATAVALSAVPATASAANRKATGKTQQRLPSLAWVREDNSIALVKLTYRAECRAPGYYWRDRVYFVDNAKRPFQREGANFSDGGKFEMKYREGPAIFNTKMTGGPSPEGGWQGTFAITVRVYNKRKKLTDFCRTPALTWKVGPAA
jgi:hypothetical protein